jgi:CBS domain-containing protein
MILALGEGIMQLTDSISSLLKQNRPIHSISPSDSVFDSIAVMAEKQVGALLVIADDKLVGIISERDYARKVILQGRSSKTTPVAEIMSSPVIYVSPAHTIGECMEIMTDQRIRHLPVLRGDQITGVISIGDLVNWTISSQRETIRHLESYITGTPR